MRISKTAQLFSNQQIKYVQLDNVLLNVLYKLNKIEFAKYSLSILKITKISRSLLHAASATHQKPTYSMYSRI